MSLKTALRTIWAGLLGILSLAIFVACNPSVADQTDALNTEGAMAAINGVAWGERLEINHAGIPAPSTAQVQLWISINNGAPVLAQVIFQTAGRVVFDLPAALPLPNLPTEFSNFIPGHNIATYYQAPAPSQQAWYTNRGTVKVQVRYGSNNVIVEREYLPYGAVKPGELTVLREVSNTGQCNLPGAYTIVNRQTTQIEGATVCYITAGFISRGTQAAINQLTALGFSADKNTVSSLDQTGANSFDPTCDQIGRWLNPISLNFPTTDMTALATYVNAQAAGVSGAGVKVYVVGGGFNAEDGFSCPVANFHKHDTHVQSIIQALAPGADVQAKVVCSDLGNCFASDIVLALLGIADEAQTANYDIVVNMSLGGPLANQPMFRALEYMHSRVLVVASGGNGFAAPRHWPASYSSRLPSPGALFNVIAVAASGFNSAGVWGLGGFNTRANGSIFAPGINLCTTTLTNFRCKNSSPFNLDDIGATGSSFAAPVVTAIAALYLDAALPQQNITPTRLGQCLVNYSRNNPLLDRMVYFDPAGC